MGLQEYLDNAVTNARNRAFEQSPQLSLGDLIKKLEEVRNNNSHKTGDDEPSVQFDFEDLFPTTLNSWRGVYAELALGFALEGEDPKIGPFIDMLKSAIGMTFEGWKGGDYRMDEGTPVWVANPGHVGETAVFDVIDDGWRAIIVTGLRKD